MQIDQLKFNQCLIELQETFLRGELTQSQDLLQIQEKEILIRLNNYGNLSNQVLKCESQLQDQVRYILVKTYQGLCHLSCLELQQSGQCLEEALEHIQVAKDEQHN